MSLAQSPRGAADPDRVHVRPYSQQATEEQDAESEQRLQHHKFVNLTSQ